MKVFLIESGNGILQNMSEENQQKALSYLKELGAEILLENRVAGDDGKEIKTADNKTIQTSTLIWAAGVKGNLIDGIDVTITTPSSRLLVNEFCQLKNDNAIFAISDIACMISETTPRGHAQVAPVAIQQGNLTAKNIIAIIEEKS
jgi:NADH dehydrogenase